MMEKVDRTGQEEFIWAMRLRSAFGDDDENWKERSFSLTPAVLRRKSLLGLTDENKTPANEIRTKYLASLLPDEILIDPNNFNDRIYDAALVVIYIHGLSDLWQNYRTHGPGGLFRLTSVLNNFVGTLIQSALTFNGDVLKFTGDAFIVMWKPGSTNIQDSVHQSIDFALTIKKDLPKHTAETEIDVRISISAGPVIFSVIGTEEAANFIVVGKSLHEGRKMMEQAESGTVIINKVAWDHINSAEYLWEVYDEESFTIQVNAFSQSWRSTQPVNRDVFITDFTTEGSYTSIVDLKFKKEEHDAFELRSCLGDAIKMDITKNITKFILPPIVQLLLNDEPIDCLTEIRYMAIIMINITTIAETYQQLVNIIDAAYRMISETVQDMNGFIYKVVFNEKDVLFSVVLGFRGYKDELESRNALFAAMQCTSSFDDESLIATVSVAVCTGLTYCGVIGHYLRRQYVVISLCIQKAQAMVLEYINKVTCDRETFLQCKLPLKHFILQESKSLGDLTDTGPIYEYVEIDVPDPLPSLTLNKYPILDRAYEVDLFTDLAKRMVIREKIAELERYRKCFEVSCMCVFGEPREGKTRLLEEMAILVPAKTPSFKINLTHLDKETPYQALKYIFSLPMGLTELMEAPERENILRSKLVNMPVTETDCLLNNILQVNFPPTSLVLQMTCKERLEACKILIQNLCAAVFKEVWIIFIDGSENIDLLSWDLIYVIMKTHLVFIVMFIDSLAPPIPILDDFLADIQVEEVHLLPINKSYHATLACQMMGVRGIPPELEKVLHQKSNGNPGWIETFLLILVQGNIIWLRKVPKNNLDSYGLIIPFNRWLSRLGSQENPVIKIATTLSTLQESVWIVHDKWNIFMTTFKDSKVELEKVKSRDTQERINKSAADEKSSMNIMRKTAGRSLSLPMENIMPSVELIDICVIASDNEKDLYVIDIEEPHVFAIVKLLDNLSSFEQLILKCASVIGEFFLRDMLVYILATQNSLKLSLAIKKLFDIGILACAEGDFGNSYFHYAPFLAGKTKNYDNYNVGCKCTGFEIPEEMTQLPKYANCGFMRFKMKHCQQTTYASLTESQRNDYHISALRYLEKKTRKCSYCGGGFFVKILGKRYEEGILSQRKRAMKRNVNKSSAKSSSSLLEEWSLLGTNPKQTISKNAMSSKIAKLSFSSLSISKQRMEADYGCSIFSPVIRPHHTRSLSVNATEVRSFAGLNFADCECDKILCSLYSRIRKHCIVIGQLEKWMFATLEYAEICIDYFNIALALNILNHALEILDGPYQNVVRQGESWKFPVMRARILTLIGRARLELGQMSSAKEIFEKALKNYGYSSPFKTPLRKNFLKLKQFMTLILNSRLGVGTKYGYVAEFCDNVSDCLALVTRLQIEMNQWDKAYVTSMWCLKKALESEKDFATLITAFAVTIYVVLRIKKTKFLLPLEQMALSYCRRYRFTVESRDLKAVASLYASVFHARMQRAQLNGALEVGICLDNLTDNLRMKHLLISVFPTFFEMLLVREDISDLLIAIITFEMVTIDSGNYMGAVWFYALNVCFHLHTGYFIKSMEECRNYYYLKGKRVTTMQEPAAEKRYLVALWLWYLRVGDFEEAYNIHERLPSEWIVTRFESIENLVTSLLYLEGLIHTLVLKMDSKITTEVEILDAKITKLIGTIEMVATYVKLIGPRFYHLKSFYYVCKMRDYEGFHMLTKSYKSSRLSSNVYDNHWALHSEKAWKRELLKSDRTFWRDHAVTDELDYHELESQSCKISYYTLEPPLYL